MHGGDRLSVRLVCYGVWCLICCGLVVAVPLTSSGEPPVSFPLRLAVIPPESRRRARARGSRPGVPSPGRGRRVGTTPQARPFPRRAASHPGRGDRAGSELRRPDRGDDAAPSLAAARPPGCAPASCMPLGPASDVLAHVYAAVVRTPNAPTPRCVTAVRLRQDLARLGDPEPPADWRGPVDSAHGPREHWWPWSRSRARQ